MNTSTEQTDTLENEKLKRIISNNTIITHYQPIISVAKNKIIGIESLARGVDKKTEDIVSPIILFSYAHANGMILELDRLCREKGIEGFKNINNFISKEFYLFINIDASVIDIVEGSNYFFNQILEHNISPKNIVIEINESKVQNIEHLVNFVKTYRNLGCLIALDDVGVGFSNFDRISLVKPDIIKIDRSLINEIGDNYYKQEIFKCLVNMANKIGAVVVAEGVETEEELNYSLESGVHLIQGYFFSKPQFFSSELIDALDIRINEAGLRFKKHMSLKIEKENIHRKIIDTLLSEVIIDFERKPTQDYRDILLTFVNSYTELNIECAYILDEQGIQISNTYFSNANRNYRQKHIFHPAVIGVDHSLKKYYYKLMNARQSKYLSNPYVSHATGNVCITATSVFKQQTNNENCIFCVDFIYDSTR